MAVIWIAVVPVVPVQLMLVQMAVGQIATVWIAIVQIARAKVWALVQTKVRAVRVLVRDLVRAVRVALRPKEWALVRALVRTLSHLDAHLSATHQTCDESYLLSQGSADHSGIYRKSGYESVGESLCLRSHRMHFLAPTTLSSLTTEISELV
jgi:hypothetical protein